MVRDKNLFVKAKMVPGPENKGFVEILNIWFYILNNLLNK